MEKAPRKKFRGAGRVAFLARKDGIQKMMEEGYPTLVIYEKYEDELNISASQFARYIKKYFRSTPNDGNQGKMSNATNQQPTTAPREKEIIKKQIKPDSGKPRFERKTDRDDLVHPKPEE